MDGWMEGEREEEQEVVKDRPFKVSGRSQKMGPRSASLCRLWSAATQAFPTLLFSIYLLFQSFFCTYIFKGLLSP